MRASKRVPFVVLWIAASISGFGFPAAMGQGDAGAPAQASNGIACRVMEVHTSAQEKVTVAVFHQRDDQDRGRLSAFLHRHPEQSVRFQTKDGAWHTATVARLKSCFGRGLLIFPTEALSLRERDEFFLEMATN